MPKYRIATIAGDGIGKEVVPEGIRVLEDAGRRFGIEFQWDHFPWSCECYASTGRMMPEDGLEQICHHDAVYLGAVGFPGVPDHISLWGLLIPIRRGFQDADAFGNHLLADAVAGDGRNSVFRHVRLRHAEWMPSRGLRRAAR